MWHYMAQAMSKVPLVSKHRHRLLRLSRQEWCNGNLPSLRIGSGRRKQAKASTKATTRDAHKHGVFVMIYIASPYSHPEASVREQRFQSACVAASELMRAGHVVYCPIAHGHPIAQHGLPTDWLYWERSNRRLLAVCDKVMVVTLEGWEESEGVQAEIQMAGELRKAVSYRRPSSQIDGRAPHRLTRR
jgi:hypothetical protein